MVEMVKRCPHCHEVLAPGQGPRAHYDGAKWLCPEAGNGEAYHEARLADALEAVAAEVHCERCGGTVLPPAQAGAPRGTCHCPENLVPAPTPTPEGITMADKPTLKLVGEDGNAFAILGRARRSAKAAGWTPEQIEAYTKAATSGDYNHLLAVTMERFDVQ